MKTVYKPWGREEWLELNSFYCYKRIYINSGYKTSFQYHNKKYETNYLISGCAEVWLENDNGIIEKKIMKEGEYFNVIPPKKHRVIALTDIILQEVSTPEVNDVIRIEDDTNRRDGLIEGEHIAPAFFILAAGMGTRLKQQTSEKNKALISINNKAIITHILNKFPEKYEIVMAVGYMKESLIEYCKLARPDRKFTFVEVDGWENSNTGPGQSARACMQYLQKPFYVITADCLVEDEIPYLDGNWIGVYPTAYPEKYSTVNIDDKNNVIKFVNKTASGYNNAFIGVAGVRDFEIFWKILSENLNDTELVTAWLEPERYPFLKAKELKWFDTGNIDDIEKAKKYFNDEPLSLHKETDEITYRIKNTFLKFHPDRSIIARRTARSIPLKNNIPKF